MSPTTYRDDGTVTVHEGEAPPAAEAVKAPPAKSRVKGAPPAPRAPRAPKTDAVEQAETQRRKRVAGKHKK